MKVYRKKEVNFDYVMILERLVPKSHLQDAKDELEEVKRSFSNERAPMLLRVFNVEEFQSNLTVMQRSVAACMGCECTWST